MLKSLLRRFVIVAICLGTTPLSALAQSLPPEQTLSGGVQIGKHAGIAYSLAFSPKGDVIASGGSDETVRLWSVFDGRQRGFTLSEDIGIVEALAFSPDARLLAASGRNRQLIWDIARGHLFGELHLADLPIMRRFTASVLAFSPDTRLLATGDTGGLVMMWSLPANRPILKPVHFNMRPVVGVAFSRNGDSLTAAYADGTGIVLGVAEQKPLKSSRPSGPVSWPMALSPYGRFIAEKGNNSRLTLRSIADGRETKFGPVTAQVDATRMAVAPDAEIVAVGHEDGRLTLWQPKNTQSEPKQLRGHKSGVLAATFSKNAKVLATSDRDGTIRLWWTNTGTPRGRTIVGHDGRTMGIAISPNGNLIAIAGSDGRVRFWNVGKAREDVKSIYLPNPYISAVAFGPKGKVLATATGRSLVQIWSVEDGKQIRPAFQTPHHVITNLAVSPDGKSVAIGEFSDTVWLWDIAEETPTKRPLRGIFLGNAAIAFSPDGSKVAASGHDGKFAIWNLHSDSPNPVVVMSPGKHASRSGNEIVYSLAFSVDGELIVSGSSRGNVHLWEAHSGRLIETQFDHPRKAVKFVRFASDGKTVQTVDADGVVRRWSVSDGSPVGPWFAAKAKQFHSAIIAPTGRFLVGTTISGESWYWPIR